MATQSTTWLAVNNLKAFNNQVAAQADKKITETDADDLTKSAVRIIE